MSFQSDSSPDLHHHLTSNLHHGLTSNISETIRQFYNNQADDTIRATDAISLSNGSDLVGFASIALLVLVLWIIIFLFNSY